MTKPQTADTTTIENTTVKSKSPEERAKFRALVTEHLRELDEKELKVIRMRFGAQRDRDDNREHTPITIERIREIEAKARARLQKSGRLPKEEQKPVTDN